MDKRVFVIGISMLAIGFASYAYLNENVPTGKADMSDDEKAALAQAEVINVGLSNIAGLVGGLGFFILLISIGLRRKKKGGEGKPITQKPAEM
ncbi:conserved exported hypothetical protein [Nitrosotalea sinensis]|jgi:hypothetical protein|uniref:Uncharacterized protein n=1 Tax=Nitrosotalea sinensis TaxID=1499975 RepID=A0A2H1EHF5_9ARCH|nr:hypothetical protein [Candidatus Nitrosotalea sinensis]SHO46023.1 conserved exported hypothetical protein [Candidatus Nitrosotalea sinensis]